MPKGNPTWTDEEMKRLSELNKEDDRWSAAQLASIMIRQFPEHQPKFTRNAIIGKLARMKEKLSNAGVFSHDHPRPRAKAPDKKKFLGMIDVGYKPRHMIEDGGLNFDKVPERNRAFTIPRKHFEPSVRNYTNEKRYERKGVCTWPLCDKESHGSYCEEHKKVVYQPRGEAKR